MPEAEDTSQSHFTRCHAALSGTTLPHSKSLSPSPVPPWHCLSESPPVSSRHPPCPEERTNSSLPPSAVVTLTTVGQTPLQKQCHQNIPTWRGCVSEAVVKFVQIAAHNTSFLLLLLRKGSPTPVTPDPAVSWGVKCQSDWTEGQRDLCLAPGSPTS